MTVGKVKDRERESGHSHEIFTIFCNLSFLLSLLPLTHDSSTWPVKRKKEGWRDRPSVETVGRVREKRTKRRLQMMKIMERNWYSQNDSKDFN